jgi:hypothetical protein
MLRCASALLCAAAALVAPVPSQAELARNFPADALRGDLQVVQPPEALLDGQPVRLAPGVRIRGENNLLLLTGAIAGSHRVVHYRLGLDGQIVEIWLLTEAERAVRPWPTSPTEARTWSFDPLAQTWTRP